jgi:hypothetical protein
MNCRNDDKQICADGVCTNTFIWGVLPVFHKVLSAAPVVDLKLKIIFVSGETKLYDVAPLLDKWDSFKALLDKRHFDAVHVDAGGYGVVWNDELDLSCDELWFNGQAAEDGFVSRVASPRK